MERPLLINSNIFEQIRESIEIGWPAVYAHTDNGRRIVTPEYIERILRAYPWAMHSMGNVPFRAEHAQSEHQRLWSSNYLTAIKNQLPEYADRYDVNGVGYKYRDVIWRTLLILETRSSERNAGTLWRCMEMRDDPASVWFMTSEEIDAYNARPRPVDPEPSPSESEGATSSGTNMLPILILGGILLGAVLLMDE